MTTITDLASGKMDAGCMRRGAPSNRSMFATPTRSNPLRRAKSLTCWLVSLAMLLLHQLGFPGAIDHPRRPSSERVYKSTGKTLFVMQPGNTRPHADSPKPFRLTRGMTGIGTSAIFTSQANVFVNLGNNTLLSGDGPCFCFFNMYRAQRACLCTRATLIADLPLVHGRRIQLGIRQDQLDSLQGSKLGGHQQTGQSDLSESASHTGLGEIDHHVWRGPAIVNCNAHSRSLRGQIGKWNCFELVILQKAGNANGCLSKKTIRNPVHRVNSESGKLRAFLHSSQAPSSDSLAQ